MQFHDSLLQMIHDSTQYEQFSEPAMKRAQLEKSFTTKLGSMNEKPECSVASSPTHHHLCITGWLPLQVTSTAWSSWQARPISTYLTNDTSNNHHLVQNRGQAKG